MYTSLTYWSPYRSWGSYMLLKLRAKTMKFSRALQCGLFYHIKIYVAAGLTACLEPKLDLLVIKPNIAGDLTQSGGWPRFAAIRLKETIVDADTDIVWYKEPSNIPDLKFVGSQWSTKLRSSHIFDDEVLQWTFIRHIQQSIQHTTPSFRSTQKEAFFKNLAYHSTSHTRATLEL